DAGVAAGGLDDGAAGLQLPGLLGRVDHGHADAVLDGAGGVVELELRDDGGLDLVTEVVQLHERGATDQLGDVLVDGHASPRRRARDRAQRCSWPDHNGVAACGVPRSGTRPDLADTCPSACYGPGREPRGGGATRELRDGDGAE